MQPQITIKNAHKQFTLDQDKIMPPHETVRRFKTKLKENDLDILEQTIRIDSGRLNIPIYFSLCAPSASAVIGTKKQMGKGATPAQSEASAVMELAERFSFFSFYQNPKNFVIEKYKNMKEKTLPFEMIAQSVHDESNDLGVSKAIFEDIPLKWTWAYNLTRQETVWIPFNWFFTINEFNGPAAGNCMEEAVVQGICEIVERHVSSLVSRNRLQVPAIDPNTASDPMVLDMLGKYGRNGIKLFVSDFTLDLGIPSVGVLGYDPATFPEKSEIVWTAGTAPDPQKALSRALTEVAQLAGDFNSSSNYVASGLPKFSKIEQAAFITRPKQVLSIYDLPDISDNNLKNEIHAALSCLADRNMEVILVNTTHGLLQIPALYTIIPGAHFRERAMVTSVAMFSAKLISESLPPQEAISKLKKINALLPGKYYLHFYLGMSHLSLNDPQAALSCFQEALAHGPFPEDLPSIYSYMGVCLKDVGDYRRALAVLEEGAKYDSQRSDIYNLMGFCHFKLKEHPEAIKCFKKVLQLDPGSAIDYANIGSNYRNMGKKEQAIRYYEMALELDPSIEFAQTNLDRLRNRS